MLNSKFYKLINLLLLSSIISLPLYAQKDNIDNLSNWEKEFLKDVDKARVVFLGEPTHNEGNVFEYKLRLAQLLHEKKGFNVIAFESEYYGFEAYQLGLYSYKNDYRSFLKDHIFGIWTGYKEFQACLDWMNDRQNELKVLGFDSQFSSDSTYQVLVELLKKESENDVDIDWEQLKSTLNTVANHYSFPEEVSLKDFEKDLKHIEKVLPQKITSDDRKLAYYKQSIKSILAMAYDFATNHPASKTEQTWRATDSNPRDAQMGNNLLALLEMYPNEKFICWGAQGHFANQVSVLEHNQLEEFIPMGKVVKDALGEEYVKTYAFISGNGYKEVIKEDSTRFIRKPIHTSLEAELSASRSTTSFISLTGNAYKNKSFVSLAMGDPPVKGVWAKVFDGFIYLDHFTSTHYLNQTNTSETNDVKVIPLEIEDIPNSDSTSFKENNLALLQRTLHFRNKKNTPKELLLKGIIKELASKEVIPFAVVRTMRGNNGAVCDIDGQFRLAVQATDTLLISSSGFEELRLPVSKIVSSSDTQHELYLKASVIELGQITVMSDEITPKDIIKKVIKNHKKNYSSPSYKLEYYARNMAYKNDTSVVDVEFVGDMFIKPNKFSRPTIKEKNKKVLAQSAFDDRDIIPFAYGGFPLLVMGGIEYDLIRSPRKTKLKRYSFEWDKSNFDSDLYIISFVENSPRYNFIHRGKLYIDMDDYAVVRYDDNLWLKEGEKFSSIYDKSRSISHTATYQKGNDGIYRMKEFFKDFHIQRHQNDVSDGASVIIKYFAKYKEAVLEEIDIDSMMELPVNFSDIENSLDLEFMKSSKPKEGKLN
ncbi:erythromycin esterase family protein [Sediminitomix flava]|uniref:Erythromycin esterase-like protein n=1 Tax=Sediminitomix flava TaxID=379075 RepID=A0A315ZGL7_SEDFL|nr:erythromycin esterase family protein [Sediminitomix flava]PWJ44482.1 erythromycin esterase-like protein [Sediminitomix flava]